MEDPPKRFFRLAPGREVRLKHAYYVTCVDVKKNPQTGHITEVHCTHDPNTRGGWSEDGRKVKGTLHWVSAAHALEAEVRLYDHLFVKENPEEVDGGANFYVNLNPRSLETLTTCQVEPSLTGAAPGNAYQFLRQGYFCVDVKDTSDERPVFNRTATLRDTWAKIQKGQK